MFARTLIDVSAAPGVEWYFPFEIGPAPIERQRIAGGAYLKGLESLLRSGVGAIVQPVIVQCKTEQLDLGPGGGTLCLGDAAQNAGPDQRGEQPEHNDDHQHFDQGESGPACVVGRLGPVPQGFTLIEAMVAIVLAGLVIVTAFGTARVGLQAHERLTSELSRIEGAMAGRELLGEALRNVRAPEQSTDPGFTLTHDTLSFVAQGGAGPLDPDYDWLIRCATGPAGLECVAAPLGHASPAEIAFRMSEVRRWRVRVLAPGESRWQSDWQEANVIPQAVNIELWNDSEPVAVPLRVPLWGWSGNERRDSFPEQ
jgi:prepilin-type N-terminal cleavage/methylation domain-containing protein